MAQKVTFSHLLLFDWAGLPARSQQKHRRAAKFLRAHETVFASASCTFVLGLSWSIDAFQLTRFKGNLPPATFRTCSSSSRVVPGQSADTREFSGPRD